MRMYIQRIALLLLATLIFAAYGGCASSAPAATQQTGDSQGYGATGAPAHTLSPAIPPVGGESENGHAPQDAGGYGGESYLSITENLPTAVNAESVITLSLKVDAAAYTNVARYIGNGYPPPADAVRTEEMINYFTYDQQPTPVGGPFALYTEIGPSPFDRSKHIAFIRVATAAIDRAELPPGSLTFLIDTSGSMSAYDKLPLLKRAFGLLADTLTEDDIVSIVTYSSTATVVLDSVSGADKGQITAAIDGLYAQGSTAGANGIQTAYALAAKNYIPQGNNRVILATDGDFNVGISDTGELAGFISEQAGTGVYLSVLGFGTGNIRDDIMETLAKNGNGNYSYINDVATAEKVLVDELAVNLYTVADDVKAQIEFNPDNVTSYRLIGYENRQLDNADFADDQKDAGEIGAGADVVMLFELTLSDGARQGLKYQAAAPVSGAYADELFEVRIRYKIPGDDESRLIVSPVKESDITAANSDDFTFAASVAAFAGMLRGSSQQSPGIDAIISAAQDSLGYDGAGYRWGFLSLLNQYKKLL